MLYNGEEVGNGDGPDCDFAVDPVDGTTLMAKGMPNAISVLAVAERGAMFDPSAVFYMNKIAAGLRLQNKRNAFLFNAQQDIAPLFAAFVSDGNDDGGGDYATLHVCLLFARKGVIRWRPHCVGLHSRGCCRARQPAGSAPARR